MFITADFWAGSNDFSGRTILACEGDTKLHPLEGLSSRDGAGGPLAY